MEESRDHNINILFKDMKTKIKISQNKKPEELKTVASGQGKKESRQVSLY